MRDRARPSRRRRALWLTLALLVLGVVAVIALGAVSTELTPDDMAYAERILREAGHGELVDRAVPAAFEDQVRAILAVQDAMLSLAPKNRGIPFDQPREPRDLYAARSGLCYDRSRAIEKILSHLGFEVRHAAVYSLGEAGSPLISLLTPRTDSHAVTEVKTSRGWLLIDSNRRWIGLTRSGELVDLGKLRKMEPDRKTSRKTWDKRIKSKMSRILASPYTYIYGLYSRHGRFYPPYTPVPDVAWSQIPYNISE